MLAVLAGGICPGVRLLFEELKRDGLDLLEFNEHMNDLSSVVLSSHELRKSIDEVQRRYRLEGLLIVGNDEFMKVGGFSNSLCSVRRCEFSLAGVGCHNDSEPSRSCGNAGAKDEEFENGQDRVTEQFEGSFVQV
jgi:hypothetical protein